MLAMLLRETVSGFRPLMLNATVSSRDKQNVGWGDGRVGKVLCQLRVPIPSPHIEVGVTLTCNSSQPLGARRVGMEDARDLMPSQSSQKGELQVQQEIQPQTVIRWRAIEEDTLHQLASAYSGMYTRCGWIFPYILK